MRQLAHGRVELVCGDIVNQDTDALVNAANSHLAGGGGVDGAIHRAAGSQLLELCQRFPVDVNGQRCPTGEVRTTTAGRLKAKYVIHAVGPVYRPYEAETAHALLRQVHRRALAAAREYECRSVAFPAISTGVYSFPIGDAARIAIHEVCQSLDSETGIDLVRFVLFERPALEVFQTALDAWQRLRGHTGVTPID